MGDLSDFDKMEIVLSNLREARSYVMFAVESQMRAEKYMGEFGFPVSGPLEAYSRYAKSGFRSSVKYLNFIISDILKQGGKKWVK